MRASTARVFMLLAACACPLACSHQAYFRPREHATAESPEGIPAAEYQLNGVGDLRLWSKGAWREATDAREGIVVHIGFEVDNDSQRVLELLTDEFELDVRLEDGTEVGPLSAQEFAGDVKVEPGASGELDIWFHPETLESPDDIDALDLHWLLRTRGEGEKEYRGSTKFRRDYGSYSRYGYYWPYGYYRPYGLHSYGGYGRYCY